MDDTEVWIGDRCFRIGDRVTIKDPYPHPDYPAAGSYGTVVSISGDSLFDKYAIGVQWDEPFREGHSCDGASKCGHGRFYFAGFPGEYTHRDNVRMLEPVAAVEEREIEESGYLLGFLDGFRTDG